jgi:hypothetical protein
MTLATLIDDPASHVPDKSAVSREVDHALTPPVARPRSKRPIAFWWTLLAAVALLVALAGPALVGRVYTADDLGAFHLPMRAFYQNCLSHGDRFDWSPQLFCGFYLTGEGQVGTYHPWHWLLYRHLPLGAAFDVECVANYPLLLLGVYCFLRRWRLRRDAALLGGLMFTFSGFCLLHFVHVNCIAVLAQVPWLLVAIDAAVRGTSPQRRMLAGAAVALLTGSQILLGYPQVVAMSLLLEAAYALLMLRRVNRIVIRQGDTAVPLAGWLGMPITRTLSLMFWKVLGVAIGGAQLLPTLAAIGESSRQTVDAAFRGSGSLDPLNLIQFVAPYLFRTRVVGQNTHELGCYAGSVTLMLAVWCVAARAAPRRLRLLARAALVTGSLGLLLALGEHGPLFPLVAWLPLFNKFRFPCRAIVLVHLALAVLAAIGWSALGPGFPLKQTTGLRNNLQTKPRRSTGFMPLGLLVVFSFVLAIGGPRWWSDYTAPAWQICVGPALALSAAWLVALAVRQARWARPALVLLMTVDLGAYGLSYAVYPHAVALDQYVAAVSVPPGLPERRVAADLAEPNQGGLRRGDALLLTGWKRVDGYAGLMPARRLNYRGISALRIAGVGWIAADAPVAEGAISLARGSANWRPLSESPLPRARLITQVAPSAEPARDLERIPLASTAIVEPSAEKAIELDPGRAGTVAIAEDRPGAIRLQVDSPGRQLLVLSESYHSGWIATVAGKPHPILRVNGDFMGLIVGPGSSEVRFDFHPASLLAGQRLSAGGLILLMAVVLAGSWRSRRRPGEHGLQQQSRALRI